MSEPKIKIIEKNTKIREEKKDAPSELETEVSEYEDVKESSSESNVEFIVPVLKQDEGSLRRENITENAESNERNINNSPQFSESARYNPNINTNVNAPPVYRTINEPVERITPGIRPQIEFEDRRFEPQLGNFINRPLSENNPTSYSADNKSTKSPKPRLPWE
jgi:hypothetical protein